MELGDRMKQYEYVTRTYLPGRMPVIIRIDGRAFHTFTKGFAKPFDDVFSEAMVETTKQLVSNISGCVLGYTQSDEISLLLKNDQTNKTEPWFKNNLSKILSISASMATLYFNRAFSKNVNDYMGKWIGDTKQFAAYLKAAKMGAMFDSRAFILPDSEIVNYFIWRQQDCVRNSILSVGQAYFSFNEMQYLKCNAIQEKLFQEKGINWNGTPTKYKRGVCIYRKEIALNDADPTTIKNRVTVDYEIPTFTEDRKYIGDKYIQIVTKV